MGVVLGTDAHPPQITLKPILDILDPFPLIPTQLWQLLSFATNYYHCSMADLLPLCIPWTMAINWQVIVDGQQLDTLRNSNDWQKLKKIGTSWQTGVISIPNLFQSRKVKGSWSIQILHDASTTIPKLTSAQTRVMSVLSDAGGTMPEDLLCSNAKVSLSVISRLKRNGLIKGVRQELKPTRQRYYIDKVIELNHEQKQAVAAVNMEVFTTYLLYGITGSGKTEVYLKLTEQALALGKRILWLVPEISLTPTLIARLEARFPKQVAVGHAGLNVSEKQTDIIRLLQNDANIFVGVRNAVIAPLQNIGLIIVDEEHEGSYKSDDHPRINARDLAIKRAQLECCPIILGSATPSLESWYAADQGRYTLLRLKERPIGAQLPTVKVVDLRESYRKEGKRVLLSNLLVKNIQKNLEHGEQSMLLLNRRGFENFWMCRACGQTIDCQRCSISLTYHNKALCLRCHLCGLEVKPPKKCDHCGTEQLRGVGEGTEQVEDILKTLFPTAKILRLDRDTTSRKGSMESGLLSVERGEIDILVGTQMLAKGHNFPMLTLVGILNADLGLKMADFRAGEHTFQLLTQVAGRAGRGKMPGRVILQTYNPEHPAIIHAVTQNFESFATEEMSYRKALEYPPYSAMSLYRSSGNTPELAIESLLKLRSELEKLPNLRILGPLEAPVAKIKNRYRMQLLVKAKDKQQLSRTTQDIQLTPGGPVTLDRDPLNF
jgi:primosomal protein N' (replication factor Y)